MGGRSERHEAAARDLRDRLKAEGRGGDAEIVDAVCRSLRTSRNTLKTLHADNMARRGRMVERHRSTVIVCASPYQADVMRRALQVIGVERELCVVSPRARDICGMAPETIIVMPNVDLGQRLDDDLDLLTALRLRQVSWGDRAMFLAL